MTVTVIDAVGGTPAGAFQGPFSGSVNANSDGTFSIDPRDQAFALAAGYIPARRETVQYVPKTAPTILTVRQIVSSVALGNTSLTIANQPDVVRQCQIRVDPGTSAITAGICRVTCGAQVDALSLVTAASTLLNVPFTKGAMTVASAVVTGLTGGTSPKIQIATTASLAVPIPPNCADVTIIKEITNSADSSANLGTLTTAGNLDTAHRAEIRRIPSASPTPRFHRTGRNPEYGAQGGLQPPRRRRSRWRASLLRDRFTGRSAPRAVVLGGLAAV